MYQFNETHYSVLLRLMNTITIEENSSYVDLCDLGMYLAQASKATCTGAASLQTQVQYRSPITTPYRMLLSIQSTVGISRHVKYRNSSGNTYEYTESKE